MSMSEQELLELLNRTVTARKGGATSVMEQLCVMFYEMGDLAKAIQRMFIHPELEEGYKQEARLALAALLLQAKILCGYWGWTLDDILQFGEEHFLETMDEYERRVRQ